MAQRVALTALVAVGVSAGTVCLQDAHIAEACLSWTSTANETTFTALCDPGSVAPSTLNWCAFGITTGVSAMFPAEVFLMMPTKDRKSVILENRQNVAHVAPACFATQVFALVSSSMTPNATSGGTMMQAVWTRPRYLTDEALEPGHLNLTSTADSPPMRVIGAAAVAPYVDYPPCDTTDLYYHSFFSTGADVDWDV
jgi:hypothetical protein